MGTCSGFILHSGREGCRVLEKGILFQANGTTMPSYTPLRKILIFLKLFMLPLLIVLGTGTGLTADEQINQNRSEKLRMAETRETVVFPTKTIGKHTDIDKGENTKLNRKNI